MNDTHNTTDQLMAELNDLRQRVTELAANGALLTQKHDMLHTLIDALPDYLYVKDTEGRFILSNVAHAQLRGLASPEALIGQSDFDFYPRDLAEKFQVAEQAILREGVPLLNDEEPNVDAAGQPRWTVTTKRPLYDQQGRIIGTFGISRDITERKHLEAAVRDSEQRYREIFEASPDAIYVLEVLEDGQHFRNLDVNPAFEKMTGTVRAELIGKTMEETSPAEVAQTVNAKYRQCVAARTTCEEEAELDLPMGRRIFRSMMVPISDANGRVRRIIGITRDITERRRAEVAEYHQRILAETLRDIATTLNSTLDLDEVLDHILTSVGHVVPYEAVNLMLIDTQARVAQVAGFHGYIQPEQEAFLRSVQFPIDTTPNLHHMFETSQPLVIPDTYQSDLWLRLPGTEWIASYVGVPIRVKGKVIGFINLDSATPDFYSAAHAEQLQVFSDQAAVALENAQLYETIRQRAEELEQRVAERTRELSEANVRLTELDRLKDDFVSRIGHELRTPLTNIKIYLGLLETGKKPEKHALYIQTLKRETDRLHQLIEDLLKISQLDTETRAVSCTPIDLNQLAADLIAAHLPLAAQHGLKLTSELEPNLPRALADAELVRQILLNLLSNALNYTRHGTVTISTQHQTHGDKVWITIAMRDTGPGLASSDHAHLFERFYRGHAARDYKTPGAGLGLSISRQLAAKLGGRITVESEEGQGSTFTVWLPAAST